MDALNLIKEVTTALSFQSETAFSFSGNTTTIPDPETGESAHSTRKRLLDQIQMQIYRQAFCRSFADTSPTESSTDNTSDENLIPILTAANNSRGRWEKDWVVSRIELSGQVLLEKDGRSRVLHLNDFATDGVVDSNLEPGNTTTLRLDAESVTWQPGFFVAFGEHPAIDESESRLVRFYWNVRSEGAPPLLSVLSERLNKFQIPYQLKCPAYSSGFHRSDSLVLYVDRRYYDISARLIGELYHGVVASLDDTVPAFTKKLAQGLALAEDPGTGESFGASRCRILAEALLKCHRAGIDNEAVKIALVIQDYEAVGIDLRLPYLSPGSSDNYAWQPPEEGSQ